MSLGMILNSFLKTWVNLINCVLANKKCVFANRRNCMKTKVYIRKQSIIKFGHFWKVLIKILQIKVLVSGFLVI